MAGDSIVKSTESVVDGVVVVVEKQKPEEVKVLKLDLSSAVAEIVGKHANLEELSLADLGLSSIREFPKLPHLRELDLSGNKISDGLNVLVANCPKIEKLLLGGNRLKNLESLEPLTQLPNLKVLDLTGNKVTKTEGYRLVVKLFRVFSNLTNLDGKDQDGKESGNEEDDSVNGDDEEDDDDEEGEDEEDGPGLEALLGDLLGEEEDDEDFKCEDSEDEDDDDDDEEDVDEEEMEAIRALSPAYPWSPIIKQAAAE